MRIGVLVGFVAVLATAIDVSAQDPFLEASASEARGPAQPSESPHDWLPASAQFDESLCFPRFWARAEFLYWWSKSSPVPVPLVTLSDQGNSTPGAIRQPGTAVLLGNQTLETGGRPGGRFTLGFSFDSDQSWALEGIYFGLGWDSASDGVFSDGSPGSAALAIPYINANTMQEDATRLSAPGSFSGAARLRVTNLFQGAEANVMHGLGNNGGLRLDFLGGFRYLNLQERLSFATNSPNVFPNPPDVFQTYDQINTRNNFYGGQVGVRAGMGNDWLFLNATGKLALGGTQQSVFADGSTSTNDYSGNGTVINYPGGYLVQPTNSGRHGRTAFAVVPEIDLNFGVRLTDWANVFVGYSFLYVSSVARPGEQIDRVINPTQSVAFNGPDSFSGPARPAPMNDATDFWVQGINLGLELRY